MAFKKLTPKPECDSHRAALQQPGNSHSATAHGLREVRGGEAECTNTAGNGWISMVCGTDPAALQVNSAFVQLQLLLGAF